MSFAEFRNSKEIRSMLTYSGLLEYHNFHKSDADMYGDREPEYILDHYVKREARHLFLIIRDLRNAPQQAAPLKTIRSDRA